MKSTWMLGIVVATLGSGCGNVEPKEADHASNTTVQAIDGPDKLEGKRAEKPAAPVVIKGRVEASRATFAVGFVSDATDVKFEVWGVDGLAVTNTEITQGGQAAAQTRFGKGEDVEVNVSFTAPSTVRSNVAIRVRGTFGGAVRERVQSFTVNANLPSATKAPGEVKVGPDGTPVRVMKAE